MSFDHVAVPAGCRPVPIRLPAGNRTGTKSGDRVMTGLNPAALLEDPVQDGTDGGH